MRHPPERPYAYLLRLRWLENGGQPVWYFTLESPDGSTRHEFRGLQALTNFLALHTRSLENRPEK